VLSTTAVSAILATSATSGGSISSDGGAAITARGVCWSTSPNPTTASSVTTNGSGVGSFTSNLTGLQPSATYYVRAYATNGVTTAYGNEVQLLMPSGILNPVLTYGSVTDLNGNTYATIVIGTQEWMAENLRSSTYANGDPIPNITSYTTTTGGWMHYENNSAYENPYGKLYNWYAAVDPRNVCPAGWHVPTDVEWQQLELTLGMPVNEANINAERGEAENVGGKMKSTGTQYWIDPNTGATNESGFSGLPGGLYGTDDSLNQSFQLLGSLGLWWSTTESGSLAIRRRLSNVTSTVNRNSQNKQVLYSVRCVRD
jgi:uncharacterized protein (TIGR02145 family)